MKLLAWRLTVGALACALATCGSSGGPAERPPESSGTVRICGSGLCRADGEPIQWRGVTAFALADLVADGRDAEARAFVSWAAKTGFSVLRVLAMNHGWMALSPAEGRRALPRVFELAREHKLVVQAVALAGTGREPFSTDTFLQEQVRTIASQCAAVPNCVLEIANEPYHSSQASLDDPTRMQALQREVPPHLPVAWGAARDDRSDRMAGGTYVVVHRARRGDKWEGVARLRDLGALAARTGKFLVDNEPIGAAEQDERSRREDDPAVFFAQGALARLFEIGSTFHCEDCLHARVPGPGQQRSAEAFVQGSRIAPLDVRLQVQPGDAAGSPVLAPEGTHAFSGLADRRAWVVVMRAPEAAAVTWRNGWRADGQIPTPPGVLAWRAAREARSARLVGSGADGR